MKSMAQLAIILLALLVGLAHGGGFDNVVDSLNTDLAPLITLFGERVTMQFISQMVGFADCFVLATVPLGIITIMVSAIRVGGPAWLKAAVGRAKENKATAELELMSSTSPEVCELYDGQTIVRCLGSGSVWQYMCLFRKGTGSDETQSQNVKMEVMTLKEAARRGFLIQTKGARPRRRTLAVLLGLDFANGPESSTETTTSASDSSDPLFTTELSLFSWMWMSVWLAVFPTSFKMAYRRPSSECGVQQDAGTQPTLIVIRDTRSNVPSVALNLQETYKRTKVRMAAFLGVLAEAALIGFFVYMSHHPEYRLNDDKPAPDYALWIAVVGTLCMTLGVFICARVVEKSTTEDVYQADDRFNMRAYWIQHKQTVNDQMFEPFAVGRGKPFSIVSCSNRNKGDGILLPIKTVVGVALGLSGFILQLVGVMGMNSVASLAQLTALGVMTALRCVVRPGYPKSFEAAKLLADFELDWLAQKLARMTTEPTSSAPALTDNVHQLLAQWFVVTGRGEEHQALQILTQEMKRQPPASEAQRLLVMRRELSTLTKIGDTPCQRAANLATAMKEGLSTLFPQGTGHEGVEGFRWILNVRFCRQGDRQTDQTQPVWIDLFYEEGAWRVDLHDLIATLSLWTYTVLDKYPSPVKDGWEPAEESEGTREPSVRVSRSQAYIHKEQVIGDMKVWGPQDNETLEVIREISRTWGTNGRSSNFQRPSSYHENIGSTMDTHATYLLFSFIWSMAMTLKGPILGRTGTNKKSNEDSNERTAPLSNSVLDHLAEAFSRVSVRSERETMLEIIWSLSATDRLPGLQPRFTSLSIAAMHAFRLGNMGLLVNAIGRVLHLIAKYANGKRGISERGAAWLLELFHNIKDRPERINQGYRVNRQHLQALERHLYRLIRNAVEQHLGSDFLGYMMCLYKSQRRVMDLAFHQTTSWELPARLGVTPLHRRAILGGSTDRVLPPEQRVFIDVQDVSNFTPLHYAAANGDIWFANQLLDLEADTTLTDFSGFTAAHHACQSGSSEMVEMFITRGVELYVQAINGAFPMHLAAGRGNHQVVKILQEARDANLRFQSDAANRSITGNHPGLEDFDGRMPVHWAAAGGHTRTVEELKADVDAQDRHGWTPLHVAVLAGHEHLIRFLCRLSADRGGRGNVCVRDLTNLQNDSGHTPLHLAARGGDSSIVGQLLEAGADANLQDESGHTPLHLAARGDDSSIVYQLLEAGADADLQDESGHTPLHLAARGDDSSIVYQLLEAGADVDLQDESGHTPLHLAARGGDSSIVYQLLEAGADANAANKMEETPLFLCLSGANAEEDVYQVAVALVEYGGCLEFESAEGKSLIDVARGKGFARVETYLKTAEAAAAAEEGEA
ncbi:hypothetical protein N0V84_007150 [Fusarium piperis]|uniref:Uncharacterized protein n=1 Tax=Fusarium piperis TaxID=1435070 RepID=A0A9W8WAH1_9HYPO|nr:hypothetical protein N0V84_007150 [Fusarium piperis]